MRIERFGLLPAEFVDNVVQVCGRPGEVWLRDLPRIVGELELKWDIAVGTPFPGLSYNFVAPAVLRDGSPAVLKISLPVDDDEIHGEAAYLKLKNGRGAVRLIDEDLGSRALLLERARPGKDLKESFPEDPAMALQVAIDVLGRLVQTAPDSGRFVTLESWTAKLRDADRYPFPRGYASRALEIFGQAPSAGRRLLHGDFHHMNVLSGGGSFVAIDPKGIIGDLKYDIAVFLNNHHGWLKTDPDKVRYLDEAVECFSRSFGIPETDLRRWAFAQKVLASFWTLTENGPRWRAQLASADVWDV